ncbi:MAG: signal peptide peptidase SppA [Pseudomonadales bacterium]
MADSGGGLRRFFGTLMRFVNTLRAIVVNVLFLILLFFALLIVFGDDGITPVPDGAALVLAPTGVLVEDTVAPDLVERLFDPDSPPPETRVKDLIDAIHHARGDDRIAMLVLDLEQLSGADLAKLTIVGEALEMFSESGKPIVATGDYFSQGQYYLASHADELYMHPMGQVLLSGYAMYGLYMKSALDKLKINMHIFRVGTHKAAVEPYMRDEMSPEAKDDGRNLINALWTHYRTRVAGNRGLDPENLEQYVQHYPTLLAKHEGDEGRLALEQGLVDELMTRDEMLARLRDHVGEDAGGESYLKVGFREYLNATREAREKRRDADGTVAVIVERGMILMGNQPGGNIGADSLVKLLRKARQDEDIDAIVLRLDTPGGSALASEIIRQELEVAQVAGKPVVISMGGVAASGGYWIASTADEIWAEPVTITGSIGIFGAVPTFENSLSELGLHSDGVAVSNLSTGIDITRRLSTEMESVLQQSVENGYRRFINLVARGRNLSVDEVDAIGQGRIWTGEKAYELGLVDDLGTLADAVASAAASAKLETWNVRYLKKPLSTRERILETLFGSAQGFVRVASKPVGLIDRALAEIYTELDALRRLNDPSHLYLLCDMCRLR